MTGILYAFLPVKRRVQAFTMHFYAILCQAAGAGAAPCGDCGAMSPPQELGGGQCTPRPPLPPPSTTSTLNTATAIVTKRAGWKRPGSYGPDERAPAGVSTVPRVAAAPRSAWELGTAYEPGESDTLIRCFSDLEGNRSFTTTTPNAVATGQRIEVQHDGSRARRAGWAPRGS